MSLSRVSRARAGRAKSRLLREARHRSIVLRQGRAGIRVAEPGEFGSFRPAPPGAESFDADRAFALLQAQCGEGSRTPGTAGHARVRRMILDQLADHVDEVAVQDWQQTVPDGSTRGGRFALSNLFGVLHGRAGVPTESATGAGSLMLATHWDTHPFADADPDESRRGKPVLGASDGASGVAVLLELARVLRRDRPHVPITFAFFDGEDLGEYYYGSRLFGRTIERDARWRPDRAVVIDMIGGADMRCTTEVGSLSTAPALWNEIHGHAEAAGLGAHFHGPVRRIGDDHLFLKRAGVPSVLLIDHAYRYWHTADDVPENCDRASLLAIGQVLARFVAGQQGPAGTDAKTGSSA